MPIILIGISVTVFVMFSNPIYTQIGELRAQSVSYDEALKNSKTLENERDKLTAKDNAIDPDNKIKLQKLLPDNVDNIRLILEIEQIGLPYGMALKDVKYNATPDKEKTTAANPAGAAVVGGAGAGDAENKEYGSWDLEFSTSGTYDNFLNFVRDIEQNLRIVDISSIVFEVDTKDAVKDSGINKTDKTDAASLPPTYKYDFKIKTYWLKN